MPGPEASILQNTSSPAADPNAGFRRSMDEPGGTERARQYLEGRQEELDRSRIAPEAVGRRLIDSVLNVNDPELLKLTTRYLLVPTDNRNLGTWNQVQGDLNDVIMNIDRGNLAKAKQDLGLILSLADPTFKSADMSDRGIGDASTTHQTLSNDANLAGPDANEKVRSMRSDVGVQGIIPRLDVTAETEGAPKISIARDAAGHPISALTDDGKTKRTYQLDGDTVTGMSIERDGVKYAIEREKSGNGGYNFRTFRLVGTPDAPIKTEIEKAYVRNLSLDLQTGDLVATYNSGVTDRFKSAQGIVEHHDGALTVTEKVGAEKLLPLDKWNRDWRTASINGKDYSFDKDGFQSVKFENDGKKFSIVRGEGNNLDIFSQQADNTMAKIGSFNGSINVDAARGTVQYRFYPFTLDGPNGNAISLLRSRAGLVLGTRESWSGSTFSVMNEPNVTGSDAKTPSVMTDLEEMAGDKEGLSSNEKLHLQQILDDPKQRGDLLQRVIADASGKPISDSLPNSVREFLLSSAVANPPPARGDGIESGTNAKKPGGLDFATMFKPTTQPKLGTEQPAAAAQPDLRGAVATPVEKTTSLEPEPVRRVRVALANINADDAMRKLATEEVTRLASMSPAERASLIEGAREIVAAGKGEEVARHDRAAARGWGGLLYLTPQALDAIASAFGL